VNRNHTIFRWLLVVTAIAVLTATVLFMTQQTHHLFSKPTVDLLLAVSGIAVSVILYLMAELSKFSDKEHAKLAAIENKIDIAKSELKALEARLSSFDALFTNSQHNADHLRGSVVKLMAQKEHGLDRIKILETKVEQLHEYIRSSKGI
jgi:hypothetical protein